MEECEKCKSRNISLVKSYEYHNIYECQNCHFWKFSELNDCCRDSYKIYVIDRKNESLYFIREQCLNCGACKNKNKPLSKKKYLHLVENELNLEREKEYKDNFQLEKNSLYESFYNSRKGKYNEYLLSEKWKTKRNEVLKRDNSLCRVCKEKKAEDVHHLTYENLFNEKLEDLISVCRKCHLEIHFPSSSNL